MSQFNVEITLFQSDSERLNFWSSGLPASLIASSAHLLPTTFSSTHPPSAREPAALITKWRKQHIGLLQLSHIYICLLIRCHWLAGLVTSMLDGPLSAWWKGKRRKKKSMNLNLHRSQEAVFQYISKLIWIKDNVEVLASDWLYRHIEIMKVAKSGVWYTHTYKHACTHAYTHTRWNDGLLSVSRHRHNLHNVPIQTASQKIIWSPNRLKSDGSFVSHKITFLQKELNPPCGGVSNGIWVWTAPNTLTGFDCP